MIDCVTMTPDFPPPDGRRPNAPPLLSRLTGVVARNGKSVRNHAKNNYEITSVNFSLRSILESPEVIKAVFAMGRAGPMGHGPGQPMRWAGPEFG